MYLFTSVLLLVFVVILGITIVDYTNAEQTLQENARLLQTQTENTIQEDLQIVDKGLKLYDNTLNQEMIEAFGLFFQEYNRSGHDPARMNLEAVRTALQGSMDLYIINSSGIIEFTTFAPDQNLDFSTIPYFYEYLMNIRESQGFFPDRAVIEPATGVTRKYAYMPTPDHQYIFELGLTGNNLQQARSDLGYLERFQTLKPFNPYVEGLRIFSTRKQLEDNPSYVPDPNLSATLDRVIQEKKTLTFDNPAAGKKVTYLYVDLRDENYGSDVSRIVEITYNTALIQQALNDLVVLHVMVAIVMLLVVSLIAFLVARRITWPIQEIVDDIDIIAAGDLDHAITGHKGTDFPPLAWKMRFSRYILLYMLLITFITVAGLTAIDLANANRTFIHNEGLIQNQTEESLNQTVQLVDAAYKVYDDNLNREMKKSFILFFDEYNRSGRDVSRMDLEQVKQQLGGMLDLYIINESMVIEYSTYEPDLGFDFKEYPYTYEYMKGILANPGFYPDRIVREIATGNFRKFAYMPSPDQRYIFELGLSGEVFQDRHGKLSYTTAINNISNRNPFIIQVLSFDMNKRMVNNYSYKPDKEKLDALGQVVNSRTTYQIENTSRGTLMRYLFIDLVDPDYASDVSWILEITYDSAQIDQAVSQLLGFHAMVALVALALSVVGGTLLSQVLTRPVKRIVSDVDRIASGDLDHTITPTVGSEFEVMERSINTMVKKLKGTIEELRKKEEELIESEERYRLVVESQSEYIARFHPDGTCIFSNEAYCRYQGVPYEQFTGKPLSLPLPQEVASFQVHLSSLVPEQPSKTIESSFAFPDGSVHWHQWNLRAFFDPNGAITEYQVVGRDITERKRMEEELRSSERKFKELVALLPQAVFELSPEGKVLYANQYTFDLMGFSPQMMEEGLLISEVIASTDREAVLNNIRAVMNRELIGGREYTLIRKDGSRFQGMVYTAPIIENSVPRGVRGTIIDLTKLRKVEEEIRRLNEELEHRVKERTAELIEAYKEMESFTYSVSHDLRAPLRAIDGFSGILLENYQNDLPPEARAYLTKVRGNAQQMALLIDALLNFSRMSRSLVVKEILDPRQVAREALEELNPELQGREVKITLHDLPPCSADPAMLKLVFQNLLSNSLKFTRQREKAEIEVGTFRKGSRMVYFVKDNGIGFDMRYAHKLFGVFQRLHAASEYEGTGVGLAIVQKIVQRHGGDVWAEADVEKGATFYFTLEGGKVPENFLDVPPR
ncbi:MAG: PAS domain S-box protein [Methanomicrobiales archaeon]|nr:PAS domain S-box protein [Methanomicrobiales archaeon]